MPIGSGVLRMSRASGYEVRSKRDKGREQSNLIWEILSNMGLAITQTCVNAIRVRFKSVEDLSCEMRRPAGDVIFASNPSMRVRFDRRFQAMRRSVDPQDRERHTY